ncbi:hypothetical protein A0H81_03512 [Grifola frondosa]|uniref:Uncharacterized protein n=1 Tax=Grifola frondosa TaxID=5627 RepID=A0A1C7MNQ2_GRIFR|nr:hypothetical protein A0H81_03512 [Grifola frondosa]
MALLSKASLLSYIPLGRTESLPLSIQKGKFAAHRLVHFEDSTRSAHSLSMPNVPGHKAKESMPLHAQDDYAILPEASLKAVPFNRSKGTAVALVGSFFCLTSPPLTPSTQSPSWHEEQANPLVFVLDSFCSFLPHDTVEPEPTSDAAEDLSTLDHELSTATVDSAIKDAPASDGQPPLSAPLPFTVLSFAHAHLILDGLHLALITDALYTYTVKDFTDLLAISVPTWSIVVHIIVESTSDLIVRRSAHITANLETGYFVCSGSVGAERLSIICILIIVDANQGANIVAPVPELLHFPHGGRHRRRVTVLAASKTSDRLQKVGLLINRFYHTSLDAVQHQHLRPHGVSLPPSVTFHQQNVNLTYHTFVS